MLMRCAGWQRLPKLWSLKEGVFLDRNLSLQTKRKVYQACVLSVLLYGAECWIPLRRQVKQLNTFHHRCIRSILGISNKQKWDERITMAEARERWGDEELVDEKIQKRRLEWLGHLACMQDHRLPKSVLFGWLPQTRPWSGPRRRWRDLAKKDLQQMVLRMMSGTSQLQLRGMDGGQGVEKVSRGTDRSKQQQEQE